MRQDFTKSSAAKRRFCCTCGKLTPDQEWYFAENAQCGNCYLLHERSLGLFQRAQCTWAIIKALQALRS